MECPRNNIWPLTRPHWPFWGHLVAILDLVGGGVFQAVWFSRWCGVIGSGWVPPALLGWYFLLKIRKINLNKLFTSNRSLRQKSNGTMVSLETVYSTKVPWTVVATLISLYYQLILFTHKIVMIANKLVSKKWPTNSIYKFRRSGIPNILKNAIILFIFLTIFISFEILRKNA